MCFMRPLTSNLYILTSFRNHYLQLNRMIHSIFLAYRTGTSPETEVIAFLFHIWIQILRLIVPKMCVNKVFDYCNIFKRFELLNLRSLKYL
jgi:hypothetical protein